MPFLFFVWRKANNCNEFKCDTVVCSSEAKPFVKRSEYSKYASHRLAYGCRRRTPNHRRRTTMAVFKVSRIVCARFRCIFVGGRYETIRMNIHASSRKICNVIISSQLCIKCSTSPYHAPNCNPVSVFRPPHFACGAIVVGIASNTYTLFPMKRNRTRNIFIIIL